MQILGEPLVDLRVVEPLPRLSVHLGCAWLEQEHMPPVLERRHVLVERLPVIGDDHDPAPGRELPGNALPLQAPRVGMPGHSLFLLGLAEALEQADAAAVGVEGIDVVDDDELVAVPVQLDVHAKGGGVALDPAGFAVEDGPDRTTLGESPGPDEDQQVEMPLGEAREIRFQPVIARQLEHFVGLSPVAFLGGRRARWMATQGDPV